MHQLVRSSNQISSEILAFFLFTFFLLNLVQLEQLENEVDKAYAQREGDMTAADSERESGYV